MLSPRSIRFRTAPFAPVMLGLISWGTSCAEMPSVAADYAWATPAGVATIDVADELRIDGVGTRVRMVHSDAPPTEVLAAWRQLWEAARHRGVDADAGGWRILSRPAGAGMLTLQVRAARGGGTIGYLSLQSAGPTTGRNSRRGSPAPPLRMPAASAILRSVESRDGPRMATQTVIRLPLRADAALRAFAGAARAAGWIDRFESPLRSLPGGESSWRDAASARWFSRGGEELALFAIREGSGALVVLDHVRPNAHSRGVGR